MEKVTLDNGLRIITDFAPWSKSATMGVWIGCGSRYETQELAGASHFIEHMLFKGTAHKTAREIAEEMDEIGGALNAFTAKEYTCVYTRALTEHVEAAFSMIAQMLTEPKFDPEDTELEKGVILEEINMYEDSPEDLCMDTLYRSVWQDALGGNILGTRETVESFNRETLLSYKAKMYVPERMVVAISGNFDRELFLELCRKYLGALKPTGCPIEPLSVEYNPCAAVKKKDFEQVQLCLAFEGVALGDPRRFALSLLHGILGSASSSRLYQRLREQLGLVYGIDSFSAAHLGGGLLGIAAAVSPKSEQQAIEEIFAVIKQFLKGIDEKELRRAKNQYRANILMSMESSGSRASHMACSELLLNSVDSPDEIARQIDRVTAQDINNLAEKLFDMRKLSVCAVGNIRDESFYKNILNASASRGLVLD